MNVDTSAAYRSPNAKDLTSPMMSPLLSPLSPSGWSNNPEIATLQKELKRERNKNIILSEEVKKLKKQAVDSFSKIEADEENVVNKLNKRLMTLNKEKEKLAIEVEQEEELLTNKMQRQVSQLKQEKVDLEMQLEQEQEAIVNKLQRKISDIESEKKELKAFLTALTGDDLSSIRQLVHNILVDNKVDQLNSNSIAIDLEKTCTSLSTEILKYIRSVNK